jgi:hypothetical protein
MHWTSLFWNFKQSIEEKKGVNIEKYVENKLHKNKKIENSLHRDSNL